ncbi:MULTISPECIES: SigE family RNA polymerase sigma factor [Kribbella]|uniref:RNA polymerase sigma-70 factor (Sigma-E family) n=1 Tax=Kribbella pratensis TaxID=2512112 RepID=A0ABY2FIP8_9ACTN|nr:MULTISPECIES: SigE family RNA polymerase sigma factor [Kribbella]TDW92069.1 RNA polymerase sigma-70 factor (sigma-E family) [Kribbella sp. VKM Ac-2566]TDW92986.1 RNA polymerase sigma-70 factor (sigma-E family) [Kribbella pratensis]
MKGPDDAEFTEFAATTIRRLRRTAYLMCGDWHRAEDAAQDALVKVYRRWHRIDRTQGLNGYAHQCLVTAVFDQSRKPWRRERLVDADENTGPQPDPVGAVDDRMLVVQALGALPPSQRACVVLRHYTDLSLEQTADILGIGVGGVKSQTSRGLTRLRELLDQTERSAS